MKIYFYNFMWEVSLILENIIEFFTSKFVIKYSNYWYNKIFDYYNE